MATYQGGQRSAARSPRRRTATSSRPASRPVDKRTNLPGGRSNKPSKPKPNMDRPGLRYEKMTDTRAPRSAYGLKDSPPARVTRASTPSRPATPTAPARTPSRSSAPKPKPPSAPKPKPPSAPKPPKMPAAQSSFGPVKSGEEYGRMIGAPKPPSSSSSAPAAKKKSSALSQAEIRKRRFNR
jgi:hypothetical protein